MSEAESPYCCKVHWYSLLVLLLYSVAQAILSEWMNQKLQLELEMDEEEVEEIIGANNKIGSPVSRSQNHSAVPQYKSFYGTVICVLFCFVSFSATDLCHLCKFFVDHTVAISWFLRYVC